MLDVGLLLLRVLSESAEGADRDAPRSAVSSDSLHHLASWKTGFQTTAESRKVSRRTAKAIDIRPKRRMSPPESTHINNCEPDSGRFETLTSVTQEIG